MDHTRLRDAGIKATYPRLKILDIFHQHAGEHMSAADLYRSLIADRSNIGLATVYRVITQLEEAGLLKRTQLDAHTTVYEINDKGHHDHMVCTHCGRILESSDPSMSRLVGDIARRSGFALESYSLVLYGGCGCRAGRRPPSRRIRMNRDQFFFHDLSHFPIVTAKHGGAPDGYSASWIREMEMLVNNPQPFVLVVPDMRQEAGHEDRKAMVEWQTTNMPRLRARCRAFIAVERDAEALEKIRKRAEKMARAFDMPFLAVASATEAMQCAREVLGQAGPGGFNLS